MASGAMDWINPDEPDAAYERLNGWLDKARMEFVERLETCRVG